MLKSVVLFSLICFWTSHGLGQEQEKKPVHDLTLGEVIETVLHHNPEVKNAHMSWLIQRKNVKAQYGEWEPEIVGSFDESELERENNAVEAASQGGNDLFIEYNQEHGAGLEGRLPTGATYQIGGTLRELENNLNPELDENDEETGRFIEEFQSFLGVSMEQPLLKDFLYYAPLAQIRAAKRDLYAAFHEYRKQLMTSISQGELAYWNLVYAQERYQMAGESVEIAQKIVTDSKERVETGKMSELDLLEAEAGLALRLSQKSDRKEDLLEAENRLKLLLSKEEIGPRLRLKAVEMIQGDPEKALPVSLEEQADWGLLLDRHPDYEIRRAELERARIALGFQKSQRLPDLRLRGSYGVSGLGLDKDESLKKLETDQFPSWSVGVELRVPLFLGIRQRNEVRIARLRTQMAEENLRTTRFEIINSLETLKEQLETMSGRIQNAQKVVKFRERLLEVELDRLDAGKSDSRAVFEVEEELFQAKNLELENWVRFREALLEFGLRRGRVLLENGYESIIKDRIILSRKVIGPLPRKFWISLFKKLPFIR